MVVCTEILVHLPDDLKRVLFIVGKLSLIFDFFFLNGQQVGGSKATEPNAFGSHL